jgi:hypothetical protein
VAGAAAERELKDKAVTDLAELAVSAVEARATWAKADLAALKEPALAAPTVAADFPRPPVIGGLNKATPTGQ